MSTDRAIISFWSLLYIIMIIRRILWDSFHLYNSWMWLYDELKRQKEKFGDFDAQTNYFRDGNREPSHQIKAWIWRILADKPVHVNDILLFHCNKSVLPESPHCWFICFLLKCGWYAAYYNDPVKTSIMVRNNAPWSIRKLWHMKYCVATLIEWCLRHFGIILDETCLNKWFGTDNTLCQYRPELCSQIKRLKIYSGLKEYAEIPFNSYTYGNDGMPVRYQYWSLLRGYHKLLVNH